MITRENWTSPDWANMTIEEYLAELKKINDWADAQRNVLDDVCARCGILKSKPGTHNCESLRRTRLKGKQNE